MSLSQGRYKIQDISFEITDNEKLLQLQITEKMLSNLIHVYYLWQNIISLYSHIQYQLFKEYVINAMMYINNSMSTSMDTMASDIGSPEQIIRFVDNRRDITFEIVKMRHSMQFAIGCNVILNIIKLYHSWILQYNIHFDPFKNQRNMILNFVSVRNITSHSQILLISVNCSYH